MRSLHTSLVGALVVAFLYVAMAQNDFPPPLTGWTGNWESAGEMYLPSWDSNGACTVGSTKYRYAYMNYTMPSAGVARMSSFDSYSGVFAYLNGFNPANPCANGSPLYNDEDDVAYSYDNYYYYPGGQPLTWVFCSSNTYGDFSGVVNQGWTNSTTNTSGNTWAPIYVNSNGNCVVESQSDLPFYQAMTLTVPSTGRYDLNAYFPRDSSNDYPSYTYMALYKGMPNMSFTMNGCGAVGENAELVDASYGYDQFTELLWQELVAGTLYTVIVSTNDNTFWGPFGWSCMNSTVFNFTYPTTTTSTVVGGFNEPMRDDDNLGSACMVNSGSYNNVPYAAIPFQIPSNTNWTWYCNQPTDYEFFVYSGANTLPVACPLTGSYLDYSDSGGPFDVEGGSPTQYTLIATPYYTSSTSPGYQVRCYLLYGPAITSGGNVVTTTTGGSTTGNVVSTTGSVSTGAVSSTGVVSTTSRVTTSASTTAKTTTGSTSSKSTTSGNSTSGSSVSARVGGAVLFVAAVFALLF